MGIVIGIFTFILILISLFLILVVLAQKAKSDGGVGAAMGGGMAEATFGAETGNVLSKSTINASIAFFVICFGLYLAHIYQHKHGKGDGRALPTIAPSSLPAAGAALPPSAAAALPEAATPATATASQPAPATQTPPAPSPETKTP